MSQRHFLLILALLLSPLVARAESARLNLTLEPALGVAGAGGASAGLSADAALLDWLSAALRYELTSPDPAAEGEAPAQHLVTAGVRLRPPSLNDRGGYLLHAGDKPGHEGNLRGAAWADLSVGLAAGGGVAPAALLGAGYELSIVDGVSLGPFARLALSATPRAALGLSISFALGGAGVHERDTDRDGLIDAHERARGTDAGRADSDQDGLKDGLEIWGDNPTNPRLRDTDGDDLPDGAEDLNANGRVDPGETDPNRADSDAGGLADGAESVELSNPLDIRDDDTDQDGVEDRRDECEKTPRGLAIDARGCAILDRDLVLEGALFAKDKGVLLAAAFPVLERVAAILRDNPRAAVEVGAHDPARGGKKGEALTLSRAEAVREYLISAGVAPERLTAAGYGAKVKRPKGRRGPWLELRRRADDGALLDPYPIKK
jgi:outer membrane protein OmpA-like peptidoglycan-associated protein